LWRATPEYNTSGDTYNPMLGRKHRAESLAKMSANRVGKGRGSRPPRLDRSNYVLAAQARNADIVVRAELSKKSKRAWDTPEIREKYLAAFKLRGPRPPRSEETRLKISEARKRYYAARRAAQTP
jgi:hypothetical protein